MEKRFILWVVLSTVFLVGLLSLRTWLFPTEPKPEETTKPLTTATVAEHAITVAAGLMTGAPSGLTLPSDLQQPRIFANNLGGYLTHVKQWAAKEAEKHIAAAPDKVIVLGAIDGGGYKLLVELSSRGAAVKKITLKDHKAADFVYAQPLHQPLVLVSDDDDGKLAQQQPHVQLERQSFRFLVDNGDITWRVKESTPTKAVFTGEVGERGITVTRTFELKPGSYHVDTHLAFQFKPGAKGEFIYKLTGPRGLPVEGIAWKRVPFRQVVVGTVDGKNAAYRKLFDPKPIRNGEIEAYRPGGDNQEMQYAGVMVQYFAALIVVSEDPAKARYIDSITPENLGDDEDVPERERDFSGKVGATLTSRPISMESTDVVEHKYLLFAGPVKVRLLKYEAGVVEGLPDRYEDEYHLNLLTDAPSDNRFSRALAYIGWNAMVVFFTNRMHWLLEHLVIVTRYYPLAIILVTLIVRAAMFPISRKQALASLRMQKLGPEMKKLQEKHKEDKQALSKAQMQLYRTHGVNPLSGCLVLLLQMPVFLGLYYALNESVHLRLAGFLWIDNLAVPDALFNWKDLPLLGQASDWLRLGPTFNILPLISVTLMVIQQKYLSPPPADEQQAAQMKMMNFMMIFMAYMFYWVAAGLCVYFIVSGAWGLLERKLLPKISHAVDSPLTPAPAATVSKSRGKPSANGERNGSSGILGKITGWCQEIIRKAEKK